MTQPKRSAAAKPRKAKPKPAADAEASTPRRRSGAAKPVQPKRARPRRTQQSATGAAAPTVLVPADVVERLGGEQIVELVLAQQPDDAPANAKSRLLIAADRWHLDPLAGEVYLRRDPSRDGSAREWTVLATRDGLLRRAEATGRFRGWDADAVHGEDSFERVDPDGSASTLRARAGVSHRHKGFGDRGDLVGGWAAVEFEGRPPVVYLASRAEYLPDQAYIDGLPDDDPMKRHPGACLIAAATSWALRRSMGMADIVGADEVRARPSVPEHPAEAVGKPAEVPLEGIDVRLVALVEEAAFLDPMLWLPAKVRALVKDADDEAKAALCDEIDRSLEPLRAERAAERERLVQRIAELDAIDPAELDEEASRDLSREREDVLRRTAELDAAPGAPAAAAA